MSNNLSVINKTKGKIPVLPFSVLRNEILGEEYILSIALIGEKEMQKINKQYRKIDKPTNILSFTLSLKSGEIILCPNIIKKEQKKFERNYRELLGYLVIHGMLHLKGFEHSSKMDILEKKYDKKYFSRDRYRVRDDKGRCRRISKRRKCS